MTPHPGSVDTLKTLSSGGDELERYRFLYDFGQYVLNGVGGDILEIGVGESSYYLSRLAEKYGRGLIHCDISPSKIVNPISVPGYMSDEDEITYLEEFENIPSNPKRVVCYAGPSDKLFKRFELPKLALAFIDGDHLYMQARDDFWNVWPLIEDHGCVILHDTSPPSEEWTDENHCGEVWRLRRDLEGHDLDVLTLARGCGIGVGLTVVRKRPFNRKKFQA